MEDAIVLGIVAVVCITAMEIVALYKGVNGKVHTAAAAAVVGIAGFAFGVGVA